MANSIQLKFVIRNSGTIFNQFYSAQVGLGVTSVLLAAFIGMYSFIISRIIPTNIAKYNLLKLLDLHINNNNNNNNNKHCMNLYNHHLIHLFGYINGFIMKHPLIN
jgi:hypothetical protein